MQLSEYFPEIAAIDPAAPAEKRMDFLAIPAKGAVYLLAGEGDQAVLLATVGDLRAALKRRLADTPGDVKSKRVEYGRVARRVYWREVYSPFAANFYYEQAARELFAGTAAAVIPWRDSWWIGVEKSGDFPRFRKTTDLSNPDLAYAGPIRDKHAAARLIELLEDLFDLCRYHNILVQAPHGKACAYKEMGKCPAPCDGSVSLGDYRRQIDAALAFAIGQSREAWREGVSMPMKAAAAAMEFERAARLKQRLVRAEGIEEGAFAHLGGLEDFAYLCLQPGRTRTQVEPWIVRDGEIQALPPIGLQRDRIKNLPAIAESLFEQVRSLPLPVREVDSRRAEVAALISHHLYASGDPGIYLRVSGIGSAGDILDALKSMFSRRPAAKAAVELAADALPGGGAEIAGREGA